MLEWRWKLPATSRYSTAKQADLIHEIWERETILKIAQKRWKENATPPLERQKNIFSFFPELLSNLNMMSASHF